MNREDANQEIRRNWKQFYPADKKGKGIICPLCGSGSGKKGSGITENPKKPGQLKCWACEFSGDIFDLIQQDKGTDYNGALQYAAAELGITIDPYRQSAAADFADDPQDAPETLQEPLKKETGTNTGQQEKTPGTAAQDVTEAAVANYRAYYVECKARANDPAALSYLQARGISPETAAAFAIGYDPAWTSPTVIKNKRAAGSTWTPPATQRIIIPISDNHYIARDINPAANPDFAKMNETGGGETGIFNRRALYDENVKTVFLHEGVFDALSVIEAGAAAVAINSTNNAGKFIQQMEKEPTAATIIICMDNDDAGKRAAATLKEGFTRLNIPFITADICGGYKDPNEALTGNRAAFVEAVQTAAKQAAEQAAEQAADDLPGLLTYTDAVNIFETADHKFIEFNAFPVFGKTARIKKHDSVVIAADTGGGKSSLAINFLNDLSEKHPCIYVNLEMDEIEVLQRLVSIQSGLELDRIQGYQNDPQTADAVNIALRAITGKKPLQIIQGAYLLEELQDIIEKSTKGREETTVVFIDHSLLMDTRQGSSGRYDRFTQVSEGLRKMALRYNIILFVLLQQNRAGKAIEDERPKNSSLKESGSWENDATQICFLWYDPAAKKKKLLLTKNRHGDIGEFTLNYWKKTQTYTEAKQGQGAAAATSEAQPPAASKREKQRAKLEQAYTNAYTATDGRPTLRAMAEAADVTTATVKSWIKEYGGCTVDGIQQDPAGIDTRVEYTGFIKLTPADSEPFETEYEYKKGERV